MYEASCRDFPAVLMPATTSAYLGTVPAIYARCTQVHLLNLAATPRTYSTEDMKYLQLDFEVQSRGLKTDDLTMAIAGAPYSWAESPIRIETPFDRHIPR
jgi:hypothetical protein